MRAEARRLIAAKKKAATQPVFNLEMKVYLKAHNPQFCERAWSLVSDEVKHTSPVGEVHQQRAGGECPRKETHSDDLLPFSRRA